MPIYEYRCMECDKEFECLVLGNTDAVTCPDCDGKNVARLMSCCSFKDARGDFSTAGGASGCSSCSGGNCGTCH